MVSYSRKCDLGTTWLSVKHGCLHGRSNKNMEYKFNQYFKIRTLVKCQEKRMRIKILAYLSKIQVVNI